MTETDATKRPLEMPETFLPLEKYRIYKLFKVRNGCQAAGPQAPKI